MDCPYCKKNIYGLTGLQELQKFQKHLHSCKKYPGRKVLPAFIDGNGEMQKAANLTSVTMQEALNIRHESGQ